LIKLKSFSYKHGAVPADTNHEHNCRPLKNPHFVERLKPLTGKDEAVQDFVKSDPQFIYLQNVALAEAFEHKHDDVTIAFGCFGGRHRSVAVAELVAKELRRSGLKNVEVEHTAL
jgi:UPF0042 nucleotide-binding protein